MKIAYIGTTFSGSSALSRAEALGALGHSVDVFDGFPLESRVERWVHGFRRRSGFGLEHSVNSEVLQAATTSRYDVLWVDKGLNVSPAMVRALKDQHPELFVIHYALDDLEIRGNVTPDMLRVIAISELVVTTKTHNLEHLRSIGARNVLMSWQGYDEVRHAPPTPQEIDVSLSRRVLFIGAWEQSRASTIETILQAGLPVTIISGWFQWQVLAKQYSNLDLRSSDLFGREYGIALGSAFVGLGFLRKQARDQHTQRSVEIPASGSLLLAERTDEHSKLFMEGEEALFFSSDAECVTVCQRLFADRDARESIARAGHARVLRDGYSWKERVRQIVDELIRLGARG